MPEQALLLLEPDAAAICTYCPHPVGVHGEIGCMVYLSKAGRYCECKGHRPNGTEWDWRTAEKLSEENQ